MRRPLNLGFDLLQYYAGYKRDYLMPRMKSKGGLDDRVASYRDIMAATARCYESAFSDIGIVD